MPYTRRMTVQLKRGGTKLTAIPNHAIWLECNCGRSASVRVAALLSSDKPPKTVADVVTRVRCSQCGVKGAKDYRQHRRPDNRSLATNRWQQVLQVDHKAEGRW